MQRNKVYSGILKASQNYGQVANLLCLSSLMAAGILNPDADTNDAESFFENDVAGYCPNCPVFKKCLICRLEE